MTLGNPGLSDFYIDFLWQIRQDVKHSSLAILAHSHIGHDARLATPEDALTLQDQVEATCATLDHIREAFPEPVPIILMGHSIGSWICMQVMRSRSDTVHTMFALFPTVSNIKNTPNGTRLSVRLPFVGSAGMLIHCQWLFNPPLPSLVSSLCSLIAPACPFLLPILFWHWPSHQRKIIQMLIQSPSSVFAALTMAHDEMQAVKALDAELLDKLKGRIKWLYGLVDKWVGIHGDEVVRLLGREVAAKNILYTDLPHAFCIRESQRAPQEILVYKSFSTQQRNS